jgi:FixJ family two-component response regulator
MLTSAPKDPFIACVDDDDSVGEAIKEMLMALGLNAVAYSSAEEFLLGAQLNRTACLITDVTMRGMSGFQLMKRLTELGHRIPTIVVTGYAKEGTRAEALSAGAVAFLRKPVGKDELVAGIQLALKRGRGD